MRKFWENGLPAVAVALLLIPNTSEATPQFARAYRVDCSYCHSAPPRLNQRGLNFVALGYRLPAERLVASRGTIPVAVWNTFDLEHRASAGLTKGFPSRVELISGGPLGRGGISYFVELRAVSQQIGPGNRLLNRSGRLEDAFLKVPFGPSKKIALTVGQFRTLDQVDVSLRLSISEPLAFSTGLAAPDRARTARLTSLRSFSPSGRQPGLRLAFAPPSGGKPADGWYSAATLPLTGELTLPFTEAASFELEGRPKGAFFETYYRRGLSSVGGHAFVGDSRRLATVVGTTQVRDRFALLGAVGLDYVGNVTRARYSIGSEFTFNQHVVTGIRVDHRTAQRRDPSVHLFLNGHVPFGPDGFRQAFRIQLEQRLQTNSNVTLVGLSHIF